MAEIKREAGDKTKGFTLQKQRALGLFFDEVKSNSNANINVAIEYKGDVFLQNEDSRYIEEEKNYDKNTSFSFNSQQILNTLVYFLEIWITEKKSSNLKFGFYSTNKITVEKITKKMTFLGVTLFTEGTLKLIIEKKLSEENLLDSIRKYLVQEYIEQYSTDIESELDDNSLTTFLNSIEWYFEQDNEKDYKKEIVEKIRASDFARFTTPYQPEFVYAALMLALEEKQDEVDTILKLLRKDSVENFFLKICAGNELNLKAYKYVTSDLTEIKIKTKIWLKTFLENKYFSNVKDKSFPELIKRKIAKHNREIKIERKNIEQTDPEKAKNLDVVVEDFGDLINDSHPTFLFGEIGSGKSTLLAHYFLTESSEDILPIFIPSTYLKGKVPAAVIELKSIINDFVNEELNITEKGFYLETILHANQEVTLIFDGLDEFDLDESKKLIGHLLNMSKGISNIRIIASGRPIELSSIVHFDQWNCLTTLDLTDKEIKNLLKNEAVGAGLSTSEAEKDALQRLKILNSKQELKANAITPLTVCLIRDFLDENLSIKTLGDIMYEVLKSRLNWHKDDQKENLATFLSEYPHTLQREKFIAPIAYKIYTSLDGTISEDAFFQIIDSNELIPANIASRNLLVSETINFFKSNFLQNIGDKYTFQSHQLHQFAVGLHLYKTVSEGKDFRYKNSRIDSWREISHAAAIARTKGESNLLKQFLFEVIDELLFTSGNTPATAVLLAEAQIRELNSKFLDKIKLIGFRPLKFWGKSDSLVPHAYSYIIKDLKQVGFNWFFNDYLNPKYPALMGSDGIAALILKFYLLRSQFNLNENEKSKLSSIIPFHLTARTFSCNELLPIVSLVLPEKFEVRVRCILLADALRNNLLRERAEALLRQEIITGELLSVKNALEIACRNKDYEPVEALKLWLEFFSDDIPKVILDNCINHIGNGESELLPILQERLGESNLEAYCRFNIVKESAISDSCAIILYQYYLERDPILIGETILKKSSWFDYKNSVREEIVASLIYNNQNREGYIITYIYNLDLKSGISELYLKYFLMEVMNSEKIYLNEFLYVVKHLAKYSLSRYPEIRQMFTKVLSKPQYYNGLKDSLNNLDGNLRFRSASVLLVCNPGNEKKALEIIIRSASKRIFDNQEFLRLCMKLNFGNSTLDFINNLVEDLPELAKTFALKLLYHNNQYKLNSILLGELISGLNGNSNFLDWSGNLLDDGVERVMGKEEFYNFVREDLMNSDQLEIKIAAAHNLIRFYYDKLDIKEKAYCWLLHIQSYNAELIEFHYKFQELFKDADFISELKERSKAIQEKDNVKEILLLRYYEVVKEEGSWQNFFLALIGSEKRSNHDTFEQLFGFIIELGNSDPDIKQKMGRSIKNIMTYPSLSEDHLHNLLIPFLSILAHEFEAMNDEKIIKILTDYRISQDALLCALLFRLGKIPEGLNLEEGYIEHISAFASNNVVPFNYFSIDDLNILLHDGDEIPNNLITAIESVIIKGDLTPDILRNLSIKGNLGCYFSTVINFSRKHKLELANFEIAKDIGSLRFDNRSTEQFYKSILLKIKDIFLSDSQCEKLYVELLIMQISDEKKSKDKIDLFSELFYYEPNFDFKLLPILFDTLIEVPYRNNFNLVYRVNEFVLGLDDEKQKELIKPLKTILKSVNNFHRDRHENDLELLSWSLSLILLYLQKVVDEEIERGFLIGLKNIFIQNGRQYATGDETYLKFTGRDLFIHSNSIIKEIEPHLFKQLIKNGIESNIPEISSVCSMFTVFTT
ncbi:NACHT domain-containing protein [Flavobacterium sp. ZS1P14]|uniref:NACHT domain-containing protein n=1 Tax=Flavobacterium sp. ZS1P14 TaxID=3401729 RepID=UPI003AAB6653